MRGDINWVVSQSEGALQFTMPAHGRSVQLENLATLNIFSYADDVISFIRKVWRKKEKMAVCRTSFSGNQPKEMLIVAHHDGHEINGVIIKQQHTDMTKDLVDRSIRLQRINANWAQFVTVFERAMTYVEESFSALSPEERQQPYVRNTRNALSEIIKNNVPSFTELRTLFKEDQTFTIDADLWAQWKFMLSEDIMETSGGIDIEFHAEPFEKLLIMVKRQMIFAFIYNFLQISVLAVNAQRRKSSQASNIYDPIIRLSISFVERQVGTSKKSFAVFNVIDNGAPMDKSWRNPLHEHDFLSRYREAVEKQGGKIDLRFSDGRGNEMSVWVPIILKS